MRGKKKICVFTGSRAEYGLLKPLLEDIKKEPLFDLQILVSGMHLSHEFGLTYREIENDGFVINEKVEMLICSDSPVGMAKSIGIGIVGYTDALQRLKPDLAIVLGDRYEALAFALTSYTMGIKLAHLYGGETTLGSLDDGFRNAITMLSSIHFTSTEKYRENLVKKGISKDRVFTVGALGIDNIMRMKLLSKNELEKELGVNFMKKNLLITFHPETKEHGKNGRYLNELLKSLDELDDTLLIFTKSNSDAEGRLINTIIEEYVRKNKNKAVVFSNLGQKKYLSIIKLVDAVVGNSSSGIIEAPSLKTPTINIGDRQKGRIKARSVIDCPAKYEEIKKALNLLYDKNFRESIKRIKNPYGDGNASKRILDILKKIKW
ncbi:MAG: UDP-N-acetylglucosamine 2-epimerase [Thermodesulfovibrio sp.]|nr:UDP-N-acetylglucosamine 2-epimerase [Thermodesulfovibrio sp.]MDW7998298.1 UDP-N-acetylglucosamine 2-epimerase [Thermodesulfovibrio sp.]